MMTDQEDIGGSERMEADLDDSSTFLNCFMMVCRETFGSCRGLEADLNDSCTVFIDYADRPHLSMKGPLLL